MTHQFTQAELEAYLDEALTAAETTVLESQLRDDAQLVKRLLAIRGRRDAGVHSLGEIWRRHRISCPDRETLGSFLLQVLEPGHQAYVQFHIDQIGCRLCLANLEDLRQRQGNANEASSRHYKYFQSSAGYLRRPPQ